uniref:Beta-1,4-N-acetylgalactosaminyltransferase n=1 Tax=Callorhinchus milii TaxID=7868 RepID=A0A4W3KJW4_CALMI
MGQANLHIFEDWCGSSIDQLRKNIHFPLFPHTRTVVKKLAVAPSWTNYGLRIFGYIHPYADSEFQFVVASDDNSEFWLSTDDTPSNVMFPSINKTLVTHTFTAVTSFTSSCLSLFAACRLLSHRKYYFELLHKQNDQGTDHVEVAWRLHSPGLTFSIIDSRYISLYTNESFIQMNEVQHIPQSIASHRKSYGYVRPHGNHPAEMLKHHPRDTFFQLPFIEESKIRQVLPECVYRPSYVIKGFPLLRYQGLQFVHLTYVYPNDYTRLTHMESENKCFYYENMYYFEREMMTSRNKMAVAKNIVQNITFLRISWQRAKDSPVLQKPRYRASVSASPLDNIERRQVNPSVREKTKGERIVTKGISRRESLDRNKTANRLQLAERGIHRYKKQPGKKPADTVGQQPNRIVHTPQQPVSPLRVQRNDGVSQNSTGNRTGTNLLKNGRELKPRPEEKGKAGAKGQYRRSRKSEPGNRKGITDRKWGSISSMDSVTNSKRAEVGMGEEEGMEMEEDTEEQDDLTAYQHVFDKAVNWEQTFSVNNLNFHALRSDWIDLRCNVSGNLLIKEQEALDIAEAYMKKLNEKHNGMYTLQQIINIEKRLDRVHGSRYLIELELLDSENAVLRLSEYIYAPNSKGYRAGDDEEWKMRNTFRNQGRQLKENQENMPLLCMPTGFTWTRDAMVHFVVPVKNQARWVQQLIFDMEELYHATGDEHFNIIIIDYSSSDMNVEKALKHSLLSRYQFVKLNGNFQRSAGLQAGIDLIKDDHSIVFLCDLHMHFPSSIIDSIRKHCVEGKLAFAPIVMRLNCGATPQEPDGYWEMNGFGLLGIYKSDLDRIGGMNTKEFRDRWGGEDWELLDRIFESGLEVERMYMRNFFHYHHSRRGMWNRKQIKVT